MKTNLKILIAASLILIAALTATGFIRLPLRVKIVRERAAIPRALHPAVMRGDTLTAYLADAAGNAVASLAVVDCVTAESFYVRIVPPVVELACTSHVSLNK